MHNQQASKGFTLIELMVVVAIIGIIASFAITSYSSSVEKTRRADGKAAVLQAAGEQEKVYAANNQYSGDITTLGGATSSEGFYTLAATLQLNGVDCAVPGTCFTITATATGAQLSDTNCATLTIDNLGRKRSYDTSATETDVCW